MGMNFDRRLTPARPDLAAASLRGQVEAGHFVDGERRRIVVPATPLRRAPSPETGLDTEVLFGETVNVFETTEEGWAWVQLERDGYVGYLSAEALGPAGDAPTHKVAALRTFVFAGPSFKLTPLDSLSLGSRINVVGWRDRYALTDTGTFLVGEHLVPVNTMATDFVTEAARLVGIPYLWGGRSSLGLDCSGLVQTALEACGITCPRDTDMQEKAVGNDIGFAGDLDTLVRGDLVFWPGHVGIIEQPGVLLHANARQMLVSREPLTEAVARIAATEAPVRTVRRL